MTLQLIELLTVLVQRPNVQEVVKQGIMPLLSTVSGYMILEHSDTREFQGDQHFFLHDKTQSLFKRRNIKNQCMDLFSSLIEVFGDEAVMHIVRIIKDLVSNRQKPEETKEGTLEAGYFSKNEQHPFKRMDVGLLLLGLFIEDIQMFSIRHPDVNLPELLSLIINLDFSNSGRLGPYLKGRSLWCYITCSEMLFMPTEHNARLKKQIVENAI